MIEVGVNELPRRPDPRPRTSDLAPHIQHDQIPPPSLVQELLDAVSVLPEVRLRESRMARPGVVALWLSEEHAGGPANAFIDDHEFCHVHLEGNAHLTVPVELRDLLIQKGWAEEHIMAKAGLIKETIVLVYAPRNHRELSVVLWIVTQSLAFATGTKR